MPRAPITDRVDTGAVQFDPEGGVYTLFFSVPRPQIAYFKLMIEAYEGVAVGRTMQRFYDEARTRSLVVVMVVPDFLAAAVALLERLSADTGARQVCATAALQQELHRNLGYGATTRD
ncbi:MAG: hypothetical protein HY899_01185 [Deltaproteobacteria bacterium]|nr:hypothetical protein [Deltaproteobacteria bacterium]